MDVMDFDASDKEQKDSKIVFEGVSPDLLRATAPNRPRVETPSKHPMLRQTRTADLEVVFSKSHRVTGEEHDPYGLRQGKAACLRSVLERIRSGRMNPVEEAKAMSFLVENQVVQSQAELAQAMDKPKSKVSEKLAILKLPRSVLLLMERYPEVITEGHAIELLRLKDEALVANVASRIMEQGLTRDRLRTEISFLLQKHGQKSEIKPKRNNHAKTYLRYFPRVDGGFDLIYRFRPDGEAEALETLIADMEAKLSYLKKFQLAKLVKTNEAHIEEALQAEWSR